MPLNLVDLPHEQKAINLPGALTQLGINTYEEVLGPKLLLFENLPRPTPMNHAFPSSETIAIVLVNNMPMLVVDFQQLLIVGRENKLKRFLVQIHATEDLMT